MIGVIFEFAGEIFEVRVHENQVYFRKYGTSWATIEGLRLNREGVIREFPDLKDKENWKQTAIRRFKDKIKSFKTEDKKIKYIIDDLKKYGYHPIAMQKKGFRVKKLK